MNISALPGTRSLRNRRVNIKLTSSWFGGIVFGFVLFLHAGNPVVSLMRGLLSGSVSIVGLLFAGVIPFLVTVYAVFVCELRLIYIVCFLRACLSFFVALGVTVAFSSAGWMICGLVLFSGTVWCCLLIFLWRRLLSKERAYWIPVFLFGFMASAAECYIISPIAASLIEI